MKRKVSILALLTLVGTFLISCSKQGDNTRLSKLTINLTDAPASFDAVNIDVIGLQVIINDSIIDLETQTGVYNLLDLVNGKDTLIVDQEVPFGMLSQVRLLLGDNNSIVTDGDSYDLKTPSAQQSGLKLNVHQDFVPGIAYEYTIDFDAGKSIVQTGKGEYILKPVLKVFSEAVSGAINGIIFPANARPLIMAISESNDTSSTFSDTLTGKFMFKGLSKGIYNIDFKPLAPFSDTTLHNISVTTGSVTSLDTLKFQ
jgi:hypothetical protein